MAKDKIILVDVIAEDILRKQYAKTSKKIKQKKEYTISQLMHENSPFSKKCYYFLDAHKNNVKYWVNMYDFTVNGCLPISTDKLCWWCKHNFSTAPIGCPLKYYEHKYSGKDKNRIEERLKSLNLNFETNDFFETEGIFCSFPCCKSYILSMKGNPLYKDCSSNLTYLYFLIIGRIDNIPMAPSWKLLKAFGGHLSIKEYRATFDVLDYKETTNTMRPYMYSNSRYIEERKVKT
jgi:hypothetical protein